MSVYLISDGVHGSGGGAFHALLSGIYRWQHAPGASTGLMGKSGHVFALFHIYAIHEACCLQNIFDLLEPHRPRAIIQRSPQ